jgi:hypothetical protein
MSSPKHIPVIGYSYERLCKDGRILVSPNHIALLNGLLDRPKGVARSYTDLARAALPHLARYRSDPRPNALLGAMHRLPSTWVERHRVGRRVECALTDRGRAIVNCDVPARVTGEGPYTGLRARPNLAETARRQEQFEANLTPLRFPRDIQDYVDETVRALGSTVMLDRHPAFDLLTSWLEMDVRANDTLCDQRTWRRMVSAEDLGRWAVANCAIEHPTEGEQLAELRTTLVGVLANDVDFIDPERAVHVVFPVRSRDGTYAVIGGVFEAEGFNNPTPLTWVGLFRSSGGFRKSMRDRFDVMSSLLDFTSLAYSEQLAIWSRGEQGSPDSDPA